MKAKRVAIIGAGLAGLSAAIRLAAAGFRVGVYEQGEGPGGKAGLLEKGGYLFDTGPSLITMKWVFDQLFREAGENLEDSLHFSRLDPVCRYLFPDDSSFDAPGNPNAFASLAAEFFDVGHKDVEEYFQYSSRIYEKSAPLFLQRSLHEASSWMNREVLSSLFLSGSLDTGRTMDQANSSFFSDPRLVQLFNRYATYNGSSPYRVPATLNIIPHVEYALGAYACKDGIYAIPSSLAALAERCGVELHYRNRVEKILHQEGGGKVQGLATERGSVEAEIVISSADALATYETLLDDAEAPMARRYRSLEPSSSGLVFFWGVRGSFPRFLLHNIIFSPDYRTEFSELFSKHTLPEEPTVYINITSKINPDHAPGNCENWFVLLNAPYNSGQDWEKERARVRPLLVDLISRSLGCSIADRIEVEEVLDPGMIARESGNSFGSLYGISSNSKTAAFLRHRNRSRRYPGLYFVGGSVHPGGGMPLALLSGKIAADLIKKRYYPMDSRSTPPCG